MNKLFTELESVTKDFLDLLAGFSQEQINMVPFKGSWTAAQITNHIFKSDSFMLSTLYSKSKTTKRKADENVQSLKAVFLNFSTKLTSPDIIVPDDIEFDKDILMSSLKNTREKISEAANTLNLSEVCSNPILGEITRLEIIHFILFHTQRHLHQLKNIYKTVHGPKLKNDQLV